jgi:hypothetical protein
VLKTGIAWNQLPRRWRLFGGDMLAAATGLTEVRVRPTLHELLLAELSAAWKLGLGRCPADASHLRALKGRSTPIPRSHI